MTQGQPNPDRDTTAEQQRTDLAATVDALHATMDIPRRAKGKVHEDVERIKRQPATALAAYLYALRTEFVTVAVVLSSLYPVLPVIVGIVFLSERLRRSQALGLAAALTATVLIAVA
ncbi:EamA family transporter [Rhodococcus koreensis]|uniref:EamA family transporter n=1 Tax=Rhodococcus koreensis TaxID=99653 RepID=UPI00198059C4|nr:EamA family transporter [Rhodococcus koreensis]QSE82939.1 EamA family transporter [Rhodococcus koreensis]